MSKTPPGEKGSGGERRSLRDFFKYLILTKIKTVFLGKDWQSKLKLFYLCYLWPFQKRLGLGHKFFAILNLKKFGKTFSLTLKNRYDLMVLQEVFVDNQYQIEISQVPQVILDLGSHIGLSILYFKLLYPQVKIYAFEPHPDNVKRIKEITESFKEDISIFPVAISDKDGLTRLYLRDSPASYSIYKKTTDGHYIEVPTKTLTTIVEELSLTNIDILKFDIEGAEFQAFSNFPFDKVKIIIGEVHPDLRPQNSAIPSTQALIDIFRKLGFNITLKQLAGGRSILQGKRQP